MPLTELVGVFPALEPLGGVQASGREAWQGIVDHLGGQRVHLLAYGSGDGKIRAALAALTKRHRAGTLLVWHLNLMKLAPLVAGAGVRVVVFLHGIEAWRRQDRLTRWALGRVNLFLSNSDHTWERFVASNGQFSGAVHRTVHLGAGTPADTPAPSPGSPPAALMLGRMLRSEDYKGHRQMIEIWPQVLAMAPGAELWIAGDGDLRPELEQLARARGLEGRVRFWGEVSEEQKVRLIAQSRCLAMPSRGEGFGLVYLEAMRLGRPCLVGDGDAGREVVNPPHAGLAADPEDQQQLIQAVCRLLRAGDEWQHWSRAARSRYEGRFTAQHFRQRMNAALFAA
jgi:phosphatidylinositol alpha-1,6-mannosyltransferase